MHVTPNFHQNKFKRLFCSNCRGFVTEIRLDDEKVSFSTCKKCGTSYRIEPPDRFDDGQGHKMIKYGVGGESYTADLTGYEPGRTI